MRRDKAEDEDHKHAHQHQGSGIAPDPAARGEVDCHLGRFRVPGAVSPGNDRPVCDRGCRPGADRVRVLRQAESLALAEARGQAVGRLAAVVGGFRPFPGEATVPWVGDRIVGSPIEGKAQQWAGRRLGQVDHVIRHMHNPSAPIHDAREVIALPQGRATDLPSIGGGDLPPGLALRP
jgi:hypothetical protein